MQDGIGIEKLKSLFQKRLFPDSEARLFPEIGMSKGKE